MLGSDLTKVHSSPTFALLCDLHDQHHAASRCGGEFNCFLIDHIQCYLHPSRGESTLDSPALSQYQICLHMECDRLDTRAAVA